VDFEIVSHERVGPIHFGMTRESVRALFLDMPLQNFHPMTPVPSDEWPKFGIRVDYSQEERCEAVLLVAPSARPLFDGTAILEKPHREICEWITSLDSGASYPDPQELSLLSPKFGFMLGAPRADEPEATRPGMAVLAWEMGYWNDGEVLND
jgi:hypothetical protein